MKKKRALFVVCIFVLCFALVAAGCGQQAAAPSGTEAAQSAGAETPSAAVPEESARASQAAADGDQLEIVCIVKVAGIPWFNEMANGVEKAAADFGVNAYLVGPSEADPALQVKMVEDYITKGVDAIIVVPSDATALEPAFKKAQEQGIKVLTNESPGQAGADWDYEMVDSIEYAHEVIDMIAEKTDGKGQYVQFVGGLTVPLHNYWADEAVSYQQEKYPEMQEVTDRLPVSESIQDSYNSTLEVLKAYPELDAIIGWGSQGPIGAAEAVRYAEKSGDIVVTGCVMPTQSAEYLDDGSLTQGYLWNPSDAGYFGVYAAMQAISGEGIENGAEFSVPGSDMVATVQDNIIGFNGLLTFTKETVGEYDF